MIGKAIRIIIALAWFAAVNAVCDTYSTACAIALGQHLPFSPNLNYAKVSADEDYYVTFTMPVDVQTAIVDLSVIFGSVRMFAAVNRKPGPSDFDFSNALTGQQDHLTIASSAHAATDKFNVLIKASPASEAFFSGRVQASALPLLMEVNGMPQTARMGKSSTLRLQFAVQSSAPVNVLTTGYGAYLPALSLLYYPTSSANTAPVQVPDAYWNADNDPEDHYLSFTPAAADIGKTFVVQLSAANMTFFSVALRSGIVPAGTTVVGTAAQDPPVPGTPTHTVVLLNGQPQRDQVGEQQEHYYVLYVPAGITGTVSINVDPIQGDSDLFVNPSSRGFYHREGDDPLPQWSSQRASGIDSINILPTDRSYLHGGGAYYITVFGYDAAQFLVRASAQDAATLLVEGYSVQDSVAKGAYKYYRFQDADPLHPVYFDLLPTVGDADLMIGCILVPTGTDAGYPSKTLGHYNFTSEMYLEDTIVIKPDDHKSCSLGAAGDTSANRGEGGTFYLAVRGYTDATYMLSAQHQFGEKVLVNGLPASGIVFRAVEQRFKIRVGFEAAELRILLSPLYGDADLYVRLNAAPDLSNFDFQSNNFNTEADSVTISEQQMCSDCWVHILVYGFVTTEFSLLATFSDGTVVLSNGVPQRGSVASDEVQYYNYLATGDCTVTLVVTSVSGWVPSLYMSKSVERPSATSADTVVRLSDSGLGVLPRVTLPGILAGQVVHIGVDGAGRNISYAIRAHETATGSGHSPTLLTLSDGVPQEDAIANGDPSWLYYQVSAPIGHETIRLRTVMEVGYVQLYATRCTTSAVQCVANGGLPTEDNYLVSTEDTDSDFLDIVRTDATSATYLVGVKSQSFYAVYQISAGFENSILALQAGVAVMDHVSKGESDFFSFYFDQDFVKLSIAITTVSGDPDLFVSTTVERPAADDTNSTWRSTEYGADVVTIDPRTDPRACVRCTYYIAVVGRRESTYTISVSMTNNLPRLIDGVPSAGSVAAGEWKYFTFHNAYGSGRDLHVTLTTATGNADLYVMLDGSIPTLQHSQYSSSHWYSNDGVDILHDDRAYLSSCIASAGASNCMVVVGVYGFYASEYTLSLTSSSSATLLQLGTVRTDAVTQFQNKYYRVLLSQGGSMAPYTLRLTVTPFSGHVQVYVSCDNMQPNTTSYQWTVTPTPGTGSFLDIPSLTAADKGCLRVGAQYYAAVRGETASSYTITASLANDSSASLLTPGHAHSSSLTARTFDYYFVRPASSYEDIRLLATVLQGDVDIYVSATWDKRPQVNAATGAVTSYVLSSAVSGDEDMTLRHDWVQNICAKRESCYIIIGAFCVWGNCRYSIQSSVKDATLQLSAGVPRRSHVDAGHVEYFKFTLSQPELDVVVSVTPISGDPDLFIGMYPLTHPTRDNFTWFQSKFGADSITLQYGDMSKHCVPRPAVVGGDCDIFIGVYGWMNTTFTVMAVADEGFRSPITLIDQSPQSGFVDNAGYAYYRYEISVPQTGSPPTDIRFSLTPTDDGDADLFLLIKPNGNKSEPGLSNYDYRSVGWGSVTEMIELTADMPLYCFSCTVYLAVYGYRACSYSLQASSSGLVSLQAGQGIGGHVSNEKFAYYSIHNSNQFAIMKFTLTMISEDADLYVLPHKPGTPFELPTRTRFQWRSLFVGSDVVSVTYEDAHYCTDCDYIVGVYGYHNSTYTLLATDTEDSIIKLVQNRPQVAAIGARDGTLFFSAVISSSAADMTVSLTSLGTGTADLYVQIYNASTFDSPAGGDLYRLPDANVRTTYKYTTAGTEDDHVFIPGPHWQESIVVILVKAISPVRFSVVATSSQRPVLLLAGVPQSHFVEFGNNEYFKFYPHADEDLHITLTARSGDPDLFVSATSPIPHCSRVATTYYTSTVCSNYTWSSRNYMTDQVILSRDSPCSAVMPGTTVSLDCDPAHSYNPSSGDPVYIGIYGYSASQFTLLVAPVGQQVQLNAGQPQLSRTSTGFICTARSPITGGCVSSSASNKKVEAAYFAFRVSTDAAEKSPHHRNLLGGGASSMQSVFDVMFTIVPSCNSSRLPDTGEAPSPSECAPGCDCAPLVVYINSCPLSKCSAVDRRPSEYYGQHKLVQTVKQGAGTTIVLNGASTGAFSPFCDPAVVGEDCGYFVAVVATPLPALSTNSLPRLESAVFTITARTPEDMVLIPCIADTFPDGVQFAGEDTILPPQAVDSKQVHGHRPTQHYYEVCSQQYLPSSQTSQESLVVELEQCSGSTSLYACGDDNHCEGVLPSARSWGYFSDSTQTCAHSWDHVRDTCISVVKNKPSLTLPQKAGNYFLMTNGTGKFELRVQSTKNKVKFSPQVVFAGMQTVEAAYITVKTVTGNTAALQWQQARVVMPGLFSPLQADFMSYTAYIFDAPVSDAALKTLATSQGISDVRFTTSCGLNYASKLVPPTAVKVEPVKLQSAEQGADYMTHTFQGLAVKTYYRLVIVATCDAACLRQVSKVTDSPRILMSCMDKAGECRPQSVVYTAATFTTGDNPDDWAHDDDGGANPGDDSYVKSLINFSIVVMVLLGIAMVGVVGYWMKYSPEDLRTFCAGLLQRGSSMTQSAADWEGDDSDPSGATSSHGLTRSSGTSQHPNAGRSFSGFSALSTMGGAKKSSKSGGTQQEGVELESLAYAPPTIASRGRPVSAEPIDFRSNTASAVGAVGEALSGAANKLFSAASSAYSATNAAARPAAHNPLHGAPVRSSAAAGYSALPPAASTSGPASRENEVELHL